MDPRRIGTPAARASLQALVQLRGPRLRLLVVPVLALLAGVIARLRVLPDLGLVRVSNWRIGVFEGWQGNREPPNQVGMLITTWSLGG